MSKNIKKSVFAKLRNNFIAGVVVLIPIGITLYLTLFFVRVSGKIIPKELNPNHYLPFDIPGIEILITIFLITLIGWISLSFLGKKLIEIINNILKKIPILRTIYSAIGQMTETFTTSKNDDRSVVLFEYPRKGIWVIGFATKESDEIINKKPLFQGRDEVEQITQIFKLTGTPKISDISWYASKDACLWISRQKKYNGMTASESFPNCSESGQRFRAARPWGVCGGVCSFIAKP